MAWIQVPVMTLESAASEEELPSLHRLRLRQKICTLNRDFIQIDCLTTIHRFSRCFEHWEMRCSAEQHARSDANVSMHESMRLKRLLNWLRFPG